MCCFRWPCARIVASQARRVVSLRRRSVLEGCVFSLPCQWGIARRPAWQARDSVCADAVFVGIGGRENCSELFWRHSPVLVLDACRKRVKVGFRGRSSTLDDFEFVASLLCVTGAALSSVLLEFRGRRGALELVVQISWQAYFGAWV